MSTRHPVDDQLALIDLTDRASNQPRRRQVEPLMTIAEVAERLGVSVRHVRRLVNERRIPFVKWGHLLRFDPVEIEAWLDRARQR
jgi:excisionase family DNA binding protein